MKRGSWTKQLGPCLLVVVTMAMLLRPAWADPVGTAGTFQVVNAFTFNIDDDPQQTFRTTYTIAFRPNYFDPNPEEQMV